MAARLADQLLETAAFYLEWGNLGNSEFESASRILLYVADLCKDYGDIELSNSMLASLKQLLELVSGPDYDLEKGEDTLEVK